MTAWVRVQLLHTTDVLADVPAEPSAWMTVHELQRLDAMSAPARRDSFVAGHWQARRLAAQALRDRIRLIARRLHRAHDPLAQGRADITAPVENT